MQIQLHHARRLCTVDQRDDALRPCQVTYFLDRHDEPVGVVDVADGEKPGPGRDPRFDSVDDFLRIFKGPEPGLGYIHHLKCQAVPLRPVLHHVLHPSVVVIGRQDLITAFQFYSHEAESHTICGAVCKGDFIDICPHEGSHLLPDFIHSREKVRRPGHIRVAVDPFYGFDLRLVHAPWRDAAGTGVHVRDAFTDQKLISHTLPVCLIFRTCAAGHIKHLLCRGPVGFRIHGQKRRRPGRPTHQPADEPAAGERFQFIRIFDTGVDIQSTVRGMHEVTSGSVDGGDSSIPWNQRQVYPGHRTHDYAEPNFALPD